MGAARGAASAGAPGSPLQRREGVEPSGRVSRGRIEGAVPAQPPAGTPGYARGIFAGFVPAPALKHMPLLQSVSPLRESIFELLRSSFCLVVVKGRGSAASPNIATVFTLHHKQPGFPYRGPGVGKLQIPSNFPEVRNTD